MGLAGFDNELLVSMVEESHDMIFLIRMDNASIVYINSSVTETLGYSLGELNMQGIEGIRRPMKPDESFSEHLENLDAEQTLTDYAMVRRKDGLEIPVEVRAKVIEQKGVRYNLAMARDISERYESGILYRDFIEGSNELVTRIDGQGRFLYINPKVEKVFGLSVKECVGRAAFEFIHPDDRRATEEAFESWLQSGRSHVVHENRQVAVDGTVHHILWQIHLHYDKSGKLLYMNSSGSDITDRVRAEQELSALNAELEEAVQLRTDALLQNMAFLESYKEALDANYIVSKSDKAGLITYVNENFLEITGYRREEVLGRPHSIVRSPDTPKELFVELWKTIMAKRVWRGVLKNRKKDGNAYWVDIVIVPILNAQGEIHEFIAVRHDITELVNKRNELEKIAFFDPLTGLPNRTRLIRDIEMAANPMVALINIDKFSSINDFYGHVIGDGLIRVLAHTLEREAECNDYTIYRLQGDEFAVLGSYEDEEQFVAWVRKTVEQLNQQSVLLEENEIVYDLSAGLSYQGKGMLLTTADIALKVAKKSQQGVVLYDDTMSISTIYENNIQWAKKLKKAIREERITAYYQPLVNNTTGAWEKYEVLVRMIDEDGSVISPFFFLSIAKQSRQYYHLTRIVMEKAIETFNAFDASFSINLSIDDILDPELQAYLFEQIERHGIGKKLIFELVESEGIENFSAVSAFVKRAKSLGCRLAIDDFGTGYSNFEYLMRLNADFIKIDGSLIKGMADDANARAIVATIVAFAKQTGLKTVAEFVKDEQIHKIVHEMGIDYSQGYLFSEPMATPPLCP